MNEALFGRTPWVEAVRGQYTASGEAYEARNAPARGSNYQFYRFGREIAIDFSDFLRRLRPRDEAWDLFLQVSLKLSSWRENSTDMHKFVSNLRTLLPRPDDQVGFLSNLDGIERLTEITKDFVKSGDFFAFRESILASNVRDSFV